MYVCIQVVLDAEPTVLIPELFVYNYTHVSSFLKVRAVVVVWAFKYFDVCMHVKAGAYVSRRAGARSYGIQPCWHAGL